MNPSAILLPAKAFARRLVGLWRDRGKTVLPCHFRELFINSKGEVFPCCLIWHRPDLCIGNVADPGIIEKIRNFAPPYCSCPRYVLRRPSPHEQPAYQRLNLELSLACQGQCAMCCVAAPDWSGDYDLYDRLLPIVEFCSPSIELLVQGGEVLIQPPSLRFLHTVKERHPALRLALVTNGCVSRSRIPEIEELFYRVTVSIVGFQPETYQRIMGLDFSVTKEICTGLIANGRTHVFLKYLTTPLGFHEIPLFLDWAISAGPKLIQIIDASTEQYVRMNTGDLFWRKIMVRTGQKVRALLVAKASDVRSRGCRVLIDRANWQHLEIDQAFLDQHSLADVIIPAESFDDSELLALSAGSKKVGTKVSGAAGSP